MEELLSTLRIIKTPGISLKSFWFLIDKFIKPSLALEFVSQSSEYSHLNIFAKSLAENEIFNNEKFGLTIIPFYDKRYPTILRNFTYSPPLLFTKGNIDLLKGNLISIVGSRNCSGNSIKFCHKLSGDLAKAGYIIVSGFARGIDSVAHQAAIENKATIAVFAGGIDVIYPLENKKLYQEIIENGLILSEHPLKTVPKAQHFPQRNRIISGLSQAIAIIEAKIASGTMITAKYAVDQNKEVFVVPGFPLDPHYQGNNYLLKNGAQILESAQDIIDFFAINKITENKPLFTEKNNFFNHTSNDLTENHLTQATLEIINLISSSPLSLEDLILLSKYPADIVSSVVVELELSGKISRSRGNNISINL